jgi:Methyltransferase domain
MDFLAQHEIAEAGHRILNPFTEEKLMLLGEICRLEPGQRQLDLASGKGEMLCRWAERFGIGGVGVDISEVFVPAARARAAELGVADRVTFEQGDASVVLAGHGSRDLASYDVVSCIGATWIGGGVGGTIDLMRPMLRDHGLMLIGEPYWREEPPAAALSSHVAADEFTSLLATMERFEAARMQLVEMVLADGDSWDRYVASQWWTVSEWLRANADHADAPAMRDYLVESRRSHLAYDRRCLGWGVFVLRAG